VLSAWLRFRVSYVSQVSAAAIASFVHESLVERETLDALRVMRRAGPVFAHADFWIAADRPRATARDEAGRRHNLDRPAVVWRDGAGLASCTASTSICRSSVAGPHCPTSSPPRTSSCAAC
jgi:hypothetical protein